MVSLLLVASCCTVPSKPGYDTTEMSKIDPCKGVYLLESVATYKHGKSVRKITTHGTGFVIDKNGNEFYLMTAGHIGNFKKAIGYYNLTNVEVKLVETGTKLEKVVSAFNKSIDYGIYKGEGNVDEVNSVIGDSNLIKKGTKVYVCGYPLGVTKNYTEGIISSENIENIGTGNLEDQFFLLTAPISEGNSGSPVCAIKGNKSYIIGIITMYYKKAQNMNIGIKINNVLNDANNKLKEVKK